MNARTLLLSACVLLAALSACGPQETTVFNPPSGDDAEADLQGEVGPEPDALADAPEVEDTPDLAPPDLSDEPDDGGEPDVADEPDMIIEPDLVEDAPDLADDLPDLIEDAPDLSEDMQELTDDLQDLTDDMQELTDDLQDLTDDMQELIEDAPDLVEDSPDLVEDVPDLVEDAPDLVEDVPEPEPDLPAFDCEGFALGQPRWWTLPLRAVTLTATGGSGAYRWSYAPDGNRSGGTLNGDLGVLLVGATEGANDRLVVEDLGCGRSLEAVVRVVVPATLEPPRLEVPVGRQLCFVVTGGSGPQGDPSYSFVWNLTRRGSGDEATVTREGCYRAGALAGVDILQVEDRRTGQLLQAAVEVIAGELALTPSAPALMLPAQEEYVLTVAGATGAYRYSVAEGDTTGTTLEPVAGGVRVVAGEAPGQTAVLVEDVYFGDVTLRVPVVVMGTARHEPQAGGTHSDDVDLISLGDVNGDGLGDVAVSARVGGHNGNSAGSVLVFLGRQGQGLDPIPAQIISGDRRGNQLGRALAAGDFNGDGCNDLAVGVYAENAGQTENGEVRVYTGCAQEAQEEWPHEDWNGRGLDNLPDFDPAAPLRLRWRVPGVVARDRMGYAVAAGDFNGDGLDDLAAAAYQAESSALRDPVSGVVYDALGRVFLFYQREDHSLSLLPDRILEGVMVQEDGSWRGATNAQLGSGRMSAARVNDDACDDLLAGSWLFDENRGVAWLFLSTPGEEGCALPPEPAVTIHPAPEDQGRAGRLGWGVALEDFNGDCRADLVVSQMLSRNLTRNNNNSDGNVLLFLARPAWSHAAPRRLLKTDADLTLVADQDDQFGVGIAVGDLDGDGIADLAAGGRFGESEGTVVNVGEVRIFRGLASPEGCQGAAPGAPLLAEPLVLPGRPDGNTDFFGQAVAILEDVDGDGVNDLAVLSERGPGLDPGAALDRLGRLYWTPGGADSYAFADMRPLDWAMPQYDDRFGARVAAVGDWNGDRFEDFAVSAPGWDRFLDRTTYQEPHQAAGATFLFLGGPDGPASAPDAIFANHNGNYGSDQIGTSLELVGDFDGDGAADLAMGAPFRDNGNSCQPCRQGAPTLGDTGAVFLYRGGQHPVTRRAPGQPLTQITDPDIIICGPQEANLRVARELSGKFDANGDGLDDLLLSNWDNRSQRGDVWMVPGQPTAQGTLICMTDAHRLGGGDNTSDLVGYGLAGADLDGDGCDEMLAGAYNDDQPGKTDAGALHVWRGWGGPGCPTAPSTAAFYGPTAGDNIGFRLATVGDLDGDGVAELAIGSAGYGTNNNGVALVLRGGVLGAALRGMGDGAAVTLPPAAILTVLTTPQRLAGTQFAYGLQVQDVNGDGLGDILVGERFSSLGGVLRRGAAHVYLGAADAAALSSPDLLILGPAAFADSDFGTSMAFARQGRAGWAVMVGAPLGEWTGPDFGEMGVVYQGLISELAP